MQYNNKLKVIVLSSSKGEGHEKGKTHKTHVKKVNGGARGGGGWIAWSI